MPGKKKKFIKKSHISNIVLGVLLIIPSILLFQSLFGLQPTDHVSKKEPIVPFQLPANGAMLGVSLYAQNINDLESIESKINKKFTIVGAYQSWGAENSEFNKYWAEDVANHGSIPLITWEPWKPISGFDRSEDKVKQDDYALQKIAAGNFDTYITTYAKDVAAYRKYVIIRFAHEMNGNWYSWGSKFNTPEEYIAAWRHIHDIFKNEGADNVIWLWSPNALYIDPAVPFADNLEVFYPGDAYVDWVGFSAFNWAARYKQNVWSDPDELFTDTIAVLKSHGKPIIIAETASADTSNPERKAGWIRDLASYIKEDKAIRGVIWFHTEDNGINWKIDSTPESEQAFDEAFDSYFIQSALLPQ